MRSCALVRSVLTTHPYVKILRHVRFLTISTQSDQGNGRALSFRVGAGLRRTAKSCHQCCQTGAVFLSQCGEFPPSPLPGFTCRTTTSALICPSSTRKSSLIVSTSRASSVSTNKPPILRSRTSEVSSRILTSFAIPVDPSSVGRLDSRVVPSRRDTLARQEALIGAHVRPLTIRLGSLCGFARVGI